MPILVGATRRGVRVDRELLSTHSRDYALALEDVTGRIKSRLGVTDINFNSSVQLARALDNAGAVSHHVYTEKGNRSTARDVLEATISDEELRDLIIYRNIITKANGDFIQSWLRLSEDDGRVHPNWNQVRSRDDFTGGKGARTGRMSCDHPNLQNPPNEYDINVPEGCPEPPVLRRVFLPEEGHVWCKRDFSGQEIRILAHFEDGALLEAYRGNPSLDPHEMARIMILNTTGLDFARKHVKITAFQIIYGGGKRSVSSQVGCTMEEAATLIYAYLKALPGVVQLQQQTKQRGYRKIPIRTWGGRQYLVEPPKLIKGQWRSFEYKLLNYLIQGSAADQTKECILEWNAARDPAALFLAAVHDEINISAPADNWQEHMHTLRQVMDMDLFDCPMRSEGFMGDTWGDVELLEEAA